MSDVLERLRSHIDYDCKEDAADEIERLRAENQDLIVSNTTLDKSNLEMRAEIERLQGLQGEIKRQSEEIERLWGERAADKTEIEQLHIDKAAISDTASGYLHEIERLRAIGGEGQHQP